ncbi:MAG TPA: fibronectin type III domain-containing protein [Candidatus Microsaccharimonas sp.]
MQPNTTPLTPIEQPPKRHIIRRIIVIIIALSIVGVVTYFIVGNVQQANYENNVKTELMKQNTVLRAAAVNSVYKQTIPASIKSSDKVKIEVSISTSGTSYCMAATSIGNAKIVYHMNEKTPADAPEKGTCVDTVTVAPSAPGDVAVASTGSTDITLEWSASPYAASYNLQCAQDDSFINGLKLQSVSGTSATVSGLSGDTAYTCRVAAVNKVGQSDWSLVVTAQTSLYSQPPANMKANIVSSSELSYSWDPVPGALYYNLQYTTDINFVKDVKTVRVDATSGSIKGLAPYTGYFFRAEAVTSSFDDTHATYSGPAFARTQK